MNAAGQHREALALFNRALDLEPDSAPALLAKGNALVALRREGDAIASYERLLALQPNDARAYFNKGSALANLFRLLSAAPAPDAPYAEAIQTFETATHLGHTRSDAIVVVLKQFAKLADLDLPPAATEQIRSIMLVPED